MLLPQFIFNQCGIFISFIVNLSLSGIVSFLSLEILYLTVCQNYIITLQKYLLEGWTPPQINPLYDNPTKWSNTQAILQQQPTNCLNMFDRFVGLALKGLIPFYSCASHFFQIFLYCQVLKSAVERRTQASNRCVKSSPIHQIIASFKYFPNEYPFKSVAPSLKKFLE